jgi:hypothetical protein
VATDYYTFQNKVSETPEKEVGISKKIIQQRGQQPL